MMPTRLDGSATKRMAMPGAEAELRLSEVNHRIGNNLALIASLVRMYGADIESQQRKISAEEICDFLNSISARIVAVGRLHQLLSATPTGTELDLGSYLRDLCDNLRSSFCKPEGFTFSYDFEADCRVTMHQLTPLCLIVSEIIINAIKYAHPSGVEGRLRVGCLRRGNAQLGIEVGDDGVGLPEGFDPAKNGGLGFRLVQVLCRQLNATCEFESTARGLAFRLEVPSIGRHAH